MTEPTPWQGETRPARSRGGSSANLADVLERVLDKGVVIAGDIKINLLDIELLTIKLRLLVASVDKAKEMGIDWWEHDPALSSKASRDDNELAEENRRLRERIAALEEAAAPPAQIPQAQASVEETSQAGQEEERSR
ncbi:gas vesicle protein [Marinactinospora thermotolerans]|uniref:Gas vesicle protein n=1 Tax=Marinactinospora thermotolerans DSM 45154 TaxID=1122192 RepID=A0A1T4P3X2_9ACTN|nr:gas vesicle protein [Marinactinospora thermotolerans]SJZ85628.1 Gas vesicle protein [Marinactinospora thermotolerans DSM 45154]